MNTGVRALRPKRCANWRFSVARESSLWLTAFGGPVVLEVNMRCAVAPGTRPVPSLPIPVLCKSRAVPSAKPTATPPVRAAASRMASAGAARLWRLTDMARAGLTNSKMWIRWPASVVTGGVAGTWPARSTARNITIQGVVLGRCTTTTRPVSPTAARICSAASPAAFQRSVRDRVSRALTTAGSSGDAATWDSKRSTSRWPVHHPARR